jgi:hypothetical protein
MIAADVAYDALRVRVNQVLLEGSVIFDLPSIPKKQAQICTYVFSPTHSKKFRFAALQALIPVSNERS